MVMFPLAGFNGHQSGRKTIIPFANAKIGKDFVVIAGPCPVESEKTIMKTVSTIAQHTSLFRGGAFKP